MSYGTYRPRMPMVVKNLIIINVIMMVVTWISTSLMNSDFMYRYFSLFYFGSAFFKPYQFITYMFMHGGLWHIFFNMYTLYFFGCVLENMWGSKKFFIFYMVCGIGAALFNQLVTYLQISANPAIAASIVNIPTVGASGAIYGLLLAYGMLFPNNELMLLFPPIRMKAKWFVLIFGAIELITGLFSQIGHGGGNIAHFAHLGGMLFGLLLILYWKKKKRLYS